MADSSITESSQTETSTGFAPPNYTQTPNELFDVLLPQIESMSELKVTLAIIRQTFGWHRDEAKLNLNRLEQLTGMNRQQVVAGVKSALERGYVGSRKEGKGRVFGLRVKGMNFIPERVLDSYPIKESPKENAPSSEGAVSATPEAPPDTTAQEFIAYLSDQLESRTVPLDETYKMRLGKDIKRALEKGTDEAVLWEWLDRIIERWDDYQLSLSKAALDVANGKTTTNGNGGNKGGTGAAEVKQGTPQEAIDRLFEITANESLKNARAMVEPVMQEVDFTQPSVPWWAEKRMGGTDNERWANMNSIRPFMAKWRKDHE